MLQLQLFESKRKKENSCELIQVLLVKSHFCDVPEIRLVPPNKILWNTSCSHDPDTTVGIYTLRSHVPDFVCVCVSWVHYGRVFTDVSFIKSLRKYIKTNVIFFHFTNEKMEMKHF